MRFSGFFSEWLNTEHVAQTLGHSRFSGPSPADQNIQVFVEMNSSPIQEASLPSYRHKLNVVLWNRITDKTYAGYRIEESLAHAFDADLRHLDPATCGRSGQ